jgi:hypothetical protein
MDNYYGEVSLNSVPSRMLATSIEKEMKTEESLKAVAEQYSGRFEEMATSSRSVRTAGRRCERGPKNG